MEIDMYKLPTPAKLNRNEISAVSSVDWFPVCSIIHLYRPPKPKMFFTVYNLYLPGILFSFSSPCVLPVREQLVNCWKTGLCFKMPSNLNSLALKRYTLLPFKIIFPLPYRPANGFRPCDEKTWSISFCLASEGSDQHAAARLRYVIKTWLPQSLIKTVRFLAF